MMQEIRKHYLAIFPYICKWQIPRTHQENGIALHPTDFALQTKWMRASALHGIHGTGTSSTSYILLWFRVWALHSPVLYSRNVSTNGWIPSMALLPGTESGFKRSSMNMIYWVRSIIKRRLSPTQLKASETTHCMLYVGKMSVWEVGQALSEGLL